MSNYEYMIKTDNKSPLPSLMLIAKKDGKALEIVNGFFTTEVSCVQSKWLAEILHPNRAVLNGEEKDFKDCGEFYAIYVNQEKSLAVDMLSGYNYDENYQEYDFMNDPIPDICDREEIETAELEKIVHAWYHAVIRKKGNYVFRIAVNASHEEVISILKMHFRTMKESSVYYKISNYTAEIYHNEDYEEDNKLITDDFLYYQTFLDVFRTSQEICLEEQIQLAKKIRQIFRNQGWPAEIIAEFEELL